MHLAFDPAIPLWPFNQKTHVLKARNNIFTRFLITALTTIAKYWQLSPYGLHQPVKTPITKPLMMRWPERWQFISKLFWRLDQDVSRSDFIFLSSHGLSIGVFPSCNDTSYIRSDPAHMDSLNLTSKGPTSKYSFVLWCSKGLGVQLANSPLL